MRKNTGILNSPMASMAMLIPAPNPAVSNMAIITAGKANNTSPPRVST